MIRIMSAHPLDEFWADRVHERCLEAGEALFRSGDDVRRLYRVMDGLIVLVRPLPHGADLVIQRARAGTIVAEASLFALPLRRGVEGRRSRPGRSGRMGQR